MISHLSRGGGHTIINHECYENVTILCLYLIFYLLFLLLLLFFNLITVLQADFRKCLNWHPGRLSNFLRREGGVNLKGGAYLKGGTYYTFEP